MSFLPIGKDTDGLMRELLAMSADVSHVLNDIEAVNVPQVEIGATPKELVLTLDQVTLNHYASQNETTQKARPILITYALVNRPYMLDLQADRSLINHLTRLGYDVYLIDWGYPTRNDRWTTFDDYLMMYVDVCVDTICERHAVDKIDLIGICQGGVMSLCYTATHGDKIANLITSVTPVDFHADDSTLSAWLRDDLAHTEAINPQAMVESIGNIPGDFINLGFLMLKPFELGLQKYLNLLGVHVEADTLANFLRLEKWIFDNPDQAGAAWREYVEDFYMHNKLIKGEIDVYGEMVDLANITLPVLNIVAEHDHLVPPASSLALRDYVGTSDYTEATFPVGHVGIYVSSRVQAKLPKLIDEWLARH